MWMMSFQKVIRMKIKLKENKYDKYQFCSEEDLVALWCNYYYSKQTVLVLFNGKEAFDTLPILNILKRDNFKVYMLGIMSSFVFIEFESPEKAKDFTYSFEHKKEIKWAIYHQGNLHAKPK